MKRVIEKIPTPRGTKIRSLNILFHPDRILNYLKQREGGKEHHIYQCEYHDWKEQQMFLSNGLDESSYEILVPLNRPRPMASEILAHVSLSATQVIVSALLWFEVVFK
jgi:hypothetical protein